MNNNLFLKQNWEPGYIILSFYVSVLGAFTAIQFVKLFFHAKQKWRGYTYLTLAAFSISICSIWCMHFIGMTALTLSFRDQNDEVQQVDIKYNILITLASMISAFVASFTALLTMSTLHSMNLVVPSMRRRRSSSCYVDIQDNENRRVLPHYQDDDEIENEADQLGKNTVLRRALKKRMRRGNKISTIVPSSSGRYTPNDSFPNASWIAIPAAILRERHCIKQKLDEAIFPGVYKRALVSVLTIVSGTIMAAGILTMHYLGMTAMRMKADMVIDIGIVAFSVILGIIACIVALWLIFVIQGSWKPFFSTFVIGIAVCGVHYIGMWAYQYRYLPDATISSSGNMSGQSLAMIATAIVCLFSFVVNGIVLRWYSSLARLQHAQIEASKNVESLFKNILPERIIDRMKNGEIRYSEKHSDVSILFADLVGFTNFCSSQPKEYVVELLDELFSSFDTKALELGVEKIKTIGDAYMAATGLNDNDNPESSAQQLLLYAQEMFYILESFNANNGTEWQLRVGIHCGEVVAGVIGRHKWAYDIWGDTVNMASRMESTGSVGEIQMSMAFKNKLNMDHLPLKQRQNVNIKGKGHTTTFLIGPEDSITEELD